MYNFKLCRVPYTYKKDGKEFTSYNFFLVSDNGYIISIEPHKYPKKNGTWFDSTKDLTILSTRVESFADLKNVK